MKMDALRVNIRHLTLDFSYFRYKSSFVRSLPLEKIIHISQQILIHLHLHFLKETSDTSTRVEYPLTMNNKVIHMAILMHGLNIAIGGVSRYEILMKVAASPIFLTDYLFSHVVYIVNRR